MSNHHDIAKTLISDVILPLMPQKARQVVVTGSSEVVVTDLSLDELHLDLLVGVSPGQLAVELRLGHVLSAGGRRRDLLVLGQVEDGRREHLTPAGPEGSQQEGNIGPHPDRSALGTGMARRAGGTRSGREGRGSQMPRAAEAGERRGRAARRTHVAQTHNGGTPGP